MVPFAADALGWLLWEAEREFISTPPTTVLFLFLFFCRAFFCVWFFFSIENFNTANLLGDTGEEAW